MNILVLGGGNIKGAFEVGVISAVNTRFAPDMIAGTSVGALNAAYLVDALGRGASYRTACRSLVGFWAENVTGFSSIARMRSWPELALRYLFRQWSGLVSMEKLYSIVAANIKKENLQASPLKLLVTAVDLHSGKLRVYTDDDADIIDAIIASTAIPVEMAYRTIGDDVLVDGGLRAVLPIGAAMAQAAEWNWSVDDLLAVSTYPLNAGEYRDIDEGNPISILERSIEILLAKQHIDSLPEIARIADGAKRFEMISPRFLLDQVFGFNFFNFTSEHIKKMMDEGEKVAREDLEKNDYRIF